ncbi:MAG: histidine ammonia-lyase [Acidobacteria bacterium]|nr:histidine ammonia-lyase [Acidobacteriota bacterium]
MIELDGSSLDLGSFSAVAHERAACELAPGARERVVAARAAVERVVDGETPVYGINTGFGDLAMVRIDPERTSDLQRRLLLSHAAGMGQPLGAEAVRGMLLLRANTLAKGYSGVRPAVIELLLALLARDLLPVVPRRGSVGASGDLAPLAHLALPLIGEGEVWVSGVRTAARDALAAAGLEPLTLEAKEGLALINGTQAMTALTALAALAARRLVKTADLIGALSTVALRGTDTAFDAKLNALRPHPGQQASAANLWQLIQGSEIRESHRENDVRVQDPYSVRCMPQVHGAVRDVLRDVEAKLVIEMNSVTDNPLVFAAEGVIVSGGNFHGEPIAIAADFLAIALAELGAISERRVEKLTNAAHSGLPPFLVEDAGLNSGYMIAPVPAAAAAAESKTLAHPASIDSLPTSACKADHVSMGMGAALKLQEVVRNTRRILAIELLAAAQGVDLLRPLHSSESLEALHASVRQHVARWDQDRFMAPDLAAAESLLAGGLDEHLSGLQ